MTNGINSIFYESCVIQHTFYRSSIINKVGDTVRLHIRMKDGENRPLDMYAKLSVGRGGNISLALWVRDNCCQY